MTITLNGTSGIVNDATDLNYTGTLTGGTGVVNIGSGQVYKDASGNVGIGTVSPTANRKLDAVISANASAGIRVTNSNGGASASSNTSYSNGTSNHEFGILGTAYTTYGVLAASEAYIYGSNQSISFGADGASAVIKFGTGAGIPERARIDSSGNLLVGTTSRASSSRVTILGENASSNGYAYVAGGNGANAMVFHNAAVSVIGTINCSATATAYNTSSDYRLKEAIAPMTGALARNALLNPVFYKWKADGSAGEGFVAHELQGPFPNAVTGEKDAVDADGKPIYQGIGTGPLDGHFAACVNELQDIITALTARITALEGAAA